MTGRHTVDSITSDALDELYDRLDAAERERAEAAQLSHRYRNDAERAEAAIARVRAALPPYTAPVHGDTSRGIQIGWDRAREAALAALDAPVPLTDIDGRTICTCTQATPCGCGTSLHYEPAPAPAATQAGDDRVLHFDHRLSESEVEEIKARWRERYSHGFTALPVDPEAERAATERAVTAAADNETGTTCTCGRRFPLKPVTGVKP